MLTDDLRPGPPSSAQSPNEAQLTELLQENPLAQICSKQQSSRKLHSLPAHSQRRCVMQFKQLDCDPPTCAGILQKHLGSISEHSKSTALKSSVLCGPWKVTSEIPAGCQQLLMQLPGAEQGPKAVLRHSLDAAGPVIRDNGN